MKSFKDHIKEAAKQKSSNRSPDILPKSGAGQEGTKTLVDTYKRDTPGQSVKK